MTASSLTLLDGGAIDRVQAFAMLTGSRLGASFVVLAVGFIYALRRRGDAAAERRCLSESCIGHGLSGLRPQANCWGFFCLTAASWMAFTQLGAPPALLSVIETAFGWAVDLIKNFVPGWALFPMGRILLLFAFKALDGALPSFEAERVEIRPDAWFRKP